MNKMCFFKQPERTNLHHIPVSFLFYLTNANTVFMTTQTMRFCDKIFCRNRFASLHFDITAQQSGTSQLWKGSILPSLVWRNKFRDYEENLCDFFRVRKNNSAYLNIILPQGYLILLQSAEHRSRLVGTNTGRNGDWIPIRKVKTKKRGNEGWGEYCRGTENSTNIL